DPLPRPARTQAEPARPWRRGVEVAHHPRSQRRGRLVVFEAAAQPVAEPALALQLGGARSTRPHVLRDGVARDGIELLVEKRSETVPHLMAIHLGHPPLAPLPGFG